MSAQASIANPTIPLAEQFPFVRAASVRLTAGLSAEDQMLQSMPDASPAKWHLAHTTWFFETFILREHVRAYRAFDERFRTVFNSYYKQLGSHPDRAGRGLFSRPTLDEVMAYRDWIDRHLATLLERGASREIEDKITLGMQHEQQHQELMLTDIKHAFWSQPLRPAYAEREAVTSASAATPALHWTEHPGGIGSIGHSGSGFCFDNELPRHDVLLRPFRLAHRPVTNGEYLEFMQDGAYGEPSLWLSEGWDTVCREGWQAPLYWERDQDGWQAFTLHGTHPVAANEPVCHLSYFEADAFARWAGARLPLESEWEMIAGEHPISGNFAETGCFHPQPAAEVGGMQQLYGDVWEWTSSPYVGYPGYQPAGGALGEYNGKFMCNQWVLRGGSCATPETHMRATYRNFFPPHARWQFMGLRLAS